MFRRFRLVRMLKWVGTLACLLILAVFIASGWYHFQSAQQRISVEISEGRLAFNYLHDISQVSAKPGTKTTSHPFRLSWSRLEWKVFSQNTLGEIPLWLLLLVALIPTLLLWCLDRRVPPGHCRKCRYNLSGNTTGRCPECGAAFAWNGS